MSLSLGVGAPPGWRRQDEARAEAWFVLVPGLALALGSEEEGAGDESAVDEVGSLNATERKRVDSIFTLDPAGRKDSRWRESCFWIACYELTSVKEQKNKKDE